jgi:beta-1,4-mannosyltransferase
MAWPGPPSSVDRGSTAVGAARLVARARAGTRPPQSATERRPDAPVGRPRRSAPARDPWCPGFASFSVVFFGFLVLGLTLWRRDSTPGVLAWYTTLVWALPVFVSAQGLAGGVVTAHRCRRRRRSAAQPPPQGGAVEELLIVVVPTVGRHDTVPALERAVRSFCVELPPRFANIRIDVVIEQDCEARDRICDLAVADRPVRIITVPRTYATPNGTRFKARANHFAHELRRAEGEATDTVWVLHMDDDTGIRADTAGSVAAFIIEQRRAGPSAQHLAQGVLAFPREYATSRLLWLADAVRPGCDISLFAITTGRGTPRTGLHGELLLLRASAEAVIGWDFGPRTIVEDARFAMEFCQRYPGRSGWFAGRSYGAAPATLADLLRQRQRWMWGLLELVASRSGDRRRWLIRHNVIVWALSPLQHPFLIVTVGLLLGDLDTAPVSVLLVPICAMNIAFFIWLYWEGLKINADSSADGRRSWSERIGLVLLVPVFTLWEAIGILRGILRFVRHAESQFTVITKPV